MRESVHSVNSLYNTSFLSAASFIGTGQRNPSSPLMKSPYVILQLAGRNLNAQSRYKNLYAIATMNDTTYQTRQQPEITQFY